jgi:hypothetical protein
MRMSTPDFAVVYPGGASVSTFVRSTGAPSGQYRANCTSNACASASTGLVTNSCRSL